MYLNGLTTVWFCVCMFLFWLVHFQLDVSGFVLSYSFVVEAAILVVGWADLLIGVIFQDVDLTWPSQRIPWIPDFVCVCMCVWNECWSFARKADTGLFVLWCRELQAVLTAI